MKYITIIFLLFSFSIQAQTKMSNEEYVEKYHAIAVRKMVEYKIPASITLAQGILESGSGNSKLALNANNHFGIKCHKEWTGEGYYMDDDTENECFRVYSNPEESFADHSLFLTSRVRYQFLFDDYKTDDYKNWAKGLKQAGYATNPKYPDLLMSIIDRYSLHQYDKMGLDDITKNTVIVENTEEDLKEWDNEAETTNTSTTDDIISFNGTEAVISNGRQLKTIAEKYNIPINNLIKFNDVKNGETFTDDQYIFLKAKKSKGASIKHFVKPGETMWEISQQYGIKLKSLYARNKMTGKEEARDDEILYLQGKRETKPRTMTYNQVLKEKQRLIDEIEAERQAKLEEERKAAEEKARKIAEEKAKKEQLEAEIQAKKELEAKRLAKQKEMEANKEAFDEAMRQLEIEEEAAIEKAKEEAKAAAAEVAKEKLYNDATVKKHTVKAGDSLYSLSNMYYITVEKLMELNNLTDSQINIDQILIVSP